MKIHLKMTAVLMISGAFIFSSCFGNGGGKEAEADSVVTISAIPGVVVPVVGVTPVKTAINTDQYTGTITWTPDDNTFAASTVYTANIILTAKPGWTMTGVSTNYFTVDGAMTTNSANTGSVTAVFPATGTLSDKQVVFSGITQTGGTAGSVTTTGLTLTFSADPVSLTDANIFVTGATKGVLSGTGTTRNLAISNITVADGETISVTVTSPAGYAITGSPKSVVVYKAPSVISISAITGVVAPVFGEVPVTTAISSDQYTGTITWSPADNPFAASTVYTANIVLTAKTGWTFSGVARNFFKVAGATATNAVNSGIVTAVFPKTGAPADTAVDFIEVIQDGGTSGTVTTTSLILTFSVDPTSLTASNISVTGATKGALSGTGTTRTLAISNITVADGGTVSVTVTSPAGFSISGSPRTAVVYKGPSVISMLSISGISPSTSGIPSTSINTTQYSGSITWSPADNPFAVSTVYTANIVLTAKTGWTLTGVAENSFTVSGATNTTNPADSGNITAVFPATVPKKITIKAIPGVVMPATGSIPVTTAIDTAQYTGVITWSPGDSPFAVSTVYTANIVLTAKTGWTFNGVTANYFTVAGASATNDANTGNVAAVFPVTAPMFTVSGSGGTAGNNQSFTQDLMTFNMKYIPGGTFPTGVNNTGSTTITRPYWIAETEVTYELWLKVYRWATTNYNSTGKRIDGGALYSFSFDYTNKGIPSGGLNDSDPSSQKPVTKINWRHAMVWCNALTEYYNSNNGPAADLGCVYYIDNEMTNPLRGANDNGYTVGYIQDAPYVNSAARGFRLPESMEWECAARYKGGSTWTAGTYASGATAAYTDNVATSLVGVFNRNYTAADTFTAVTEPATVKSKNSNSLGIYDMSGNVWEWCFDIGQNTETYFTRILRGGSYINTAQSLIVGDNSAQWPDYRHSCIGFRIVRTE